MPAYKFCILFLAGLFCLLAESYAQTTDPRPAVRDTLLVGLTRSSLTPLYYGLGTDRLGGARLETLDSAVVLRLSGRDTSGRFWRVRLAPTLSAFVPVEQVAVDTILRYPVGALSGNWSVSGDTVGGPSPPRFDYVVVRLPARLPYLSQLLANGRLMVDVFGVASNTNWITQLRTAKTIKNVWFEQLADEVLRVYIDLKESKSWGYSIYYQRTSLVIRVRRPPARRSLRGLAIAVDAGHGGSNTGAKGSQSNVLEKTMTLDVAQTLRQQLTRSGAIVLMTRETDTTIGPTDRIRAMRRAQPNLLVSIHFNSSSNQNVRGVSTYYKHPGFRPLSQAVLDELLKIKTDAGAMPEFGNVGHFNFFFNTPTDYPNVLVEGPFLSNTLDEKLIINPRFRQRMAQAVARGVKRFMKQR